MVLNLVRPLLYRVSHRAPFSVKPLLFPSHINDITADIESEIRLFVDDWVCYRQIKDIEDTLKLQSDIDRLGSWTRKWGMRFQPVKFNMMQLTRKLTNKIQASYTLEDTVLEMLKTSNISVLQLQMISNGIHISAIFVLKLTEPLDS